MSIIICLSLNNPLDPPLTQTLNGGIIFFVLCPDAHPNTNRVLNKLLSLYCDTFQQHHSYFIKLLDFYSHALVAMWLNQTWSKWMISLQKGKILSKSTVLQGIHPPNQFIYYFFFNTEKFKDYCSLEFSSSDSSFEQNMLQKGTLSSRQFN